MTVVDLSKRVEMSLWPGVASARLWPGREPLEIEARAVTFLVEFDAGDEFQTRLTYEAWWTAPERAIEAGFVGAELPEGWRHFCEQRFKFHPRPLSPLRRGWVAGGQVKVWPGATCYIRSAPIGSELPWEIGVESPLSAAWTDQGARVTGRHLGVSRERAGQALLGGERVKPELSLIYHSGYFWKTLVEQLYARTGWVFVFIDQGRVLAIKDLKVERERIG